MNSVAPTVVEMPLTARLLDDPVYRQWVADMLPLGRMAQPEDVAVAVLYLVSRASGMVTGTSILVDGGWTAR